MQIKCSYPSVFCVRLQSRGQMGKLRARRLLHILPEGRRQRKECEGWKASSWLCGWGRRGKVHEGGQRTAVIWLPPFTMLSSVFWPEAVLPLYQAVIQPVMPRWKQCMRRFPAFRERQLAHRIPVVGLLAVGEEAHHRYITCKRYDVLSAFWQNTVRSQQEQTLLYGLYPIFFWCKFESLGSSIRYCSYISASCFRAMTGHL